jgi:hypothetical protein
LLWVLNFQKNLKTDGGSLVLNFQKT